MSRFASSHQKYNRRSPRQPEMGPGISSNRPGRVSFPAISNAIHTAAISVQRMHDPNRDELIWATSFTRDFGVSQNAAGIGWDSISVRCLASMVNRQAVVYFLESRCFEIGRDCHGFEYEAAIGPHVFHNAAAGPKMFLPAFQNGCE